MRCRNLAVGLKQHFAIGATKFLDKAIQPIVKIQLAAVWIWWSDTPKRPVATKYSI